MPGQNSICRPISAGESLVTERKATLAVARPGKMIPFGRITRPKTSEDSFLLQNIAAGNEQAFAVMYNRKRLIIQKFITVLSETEAQSADDIGQDIFLTLWEKRKTLATIESFDGYLFCMVRNRLISEKARFNIRQKGLAHMSRISPDSIESTEEYIHYHELYRIYEEGISELTPRVKTAYELRENAGLKNKDVAKAMGISSSVAKQHVMAAKKKIRSFILREYA